MKYYILYPRNLKKGKVKVTKKRPNPKTYDKTHGFAEGPFKNKKAVIKRLDQMNIPASMRSKEYYASYQKM